MLKRTIVALLLFLGASSVSNCHEVKPLQINIMEDESNDIDTLSFSPDGNLIAGGSWCGSIRLFDVKKKTVTQTFNLSDEEIGSVSFAPDGNSLATASSSVLLKSAPGTVRLWDVRTGKEKAKFAEDKTGFRAVNFSPDGKMLAVGDYDGRLTFFDVGTTKLVKTINVTGEPVHSFAFSPDGCLIATANYDGTARIHDAATGLERKVFMVNPKEKKVYTVAFSPDGKTLAAGGWDGIKFWSLPTGDEVSCLKTPPRGVIASIRFSPDGRQFASVGNLTFRLWNLAESKCLIEYHHRNIFWCLSFSPDSKLVVAGDSKGELLFWDAP